MSIEKKIKILNWNDYYRRGGKFKEVRNIFFSPDGALAVAVFHGPETFVAARIIEKNEEGYVADFVDKFKCSRDDFDFHICNVDWSWLKYGFCKLCLRSMESGSYDVHRFYFDRDLYLRKRAELAAADAVEKQAHSDSTAL